MRILYFAWLRERVGVAEEEVDPPASIRDLAALMGWLAQRSPRHAAAFADPRQVRAAVNQDFADPDQLVAAGDEVAFFPPVTGG